MASFTDSPVQFAPYVSQIPNDLMLKVGMDKQQKYEQGIQRIQSNIDNVAGLDIYKDVDKKYLESKLNALGNDLKFVGASDFSDFQLVNSVNGMTNQITKDKNILTAVSATATAKKEIALMEKEREKGILNPSNEYVFNQQLNNWIGNEKVGQNFNGKYDPSFDVFKFTKETFDAVKPDGFSYDQIYQLDADKKPMHDSKGNLILSPTMTRMEKEGIFPQKVKETLAQIFSDPRVSKQLSIDGRYNYRNFDSNLLVEKVTKQKEVILGSYENQLQELFLQQNMGKDVQKDIDTLTSQMVSVNSSYDEYSKLANTDPETVRGLLYKDDVNARYTTMFSQMKEKNQVMENPGWNQSFKLQQEANEQSRFAQTLRQQKIAHADTMELGWANNAQRERLATLAANKKAKGKTLGGNDTSVGEGPGGEPTEQAAQSAAIEVIRVQNANFEEAANNYSNSSDGFIWETVLGKIPSNDTKLKGLMTKGMDRNSAISLMINNAAKASGQSPEQFKTHWSDKATTEYNKLTPEQKAARPIISDTYHQYRDSKRIFDSELIIKKKIDEQTQSDLGEVGKKIAMTNFKPQSITYKDKQYTLSKDDMLDLAIYKKGNLGFMQSIFGGDDTKALAQESKMALARLTKRGKGELAEAYTNDNKNTIVHDDGKITTVDSGHVIPDLSDLRNYRNAILYGSERGPKRNWSQVHSVEGIMNNQAYSEGIKKKAEIIQQHYSIAPNRNIDILTGDNETDKSTLAKLKRWGGEAVTGAGNLSPDFKNFNSSLSNNPNDNNIGAHTIFDENNKPMVEVVSYGKDGSRKGAITLQPDQASKINIDLGVLYESKETSSLRNKLNYNNYQSSAQDPSQVSTYVSGDSWYDKTDFPGMKGSKNFDVQSNIVLSNGKYYPFIYVSDGFTKTVKQLNGNENLENLLTTLKTVITPTFVKGLITTPN